MYRCLYIVLYQFHSALKNFHGVLVYQHALVLLYIGTILWSHLVLEVVAGHASSTLDDYVEELADLIDFHSYVLLC